MPATPTDAELLRELDRLEAESAARRAELRRLATVLPHAVSRRAVLRSMVADLRGAPDRSRLLRRALQKALRVPAGLLRRARRLPGET